MENQCGVVILAAGSSARLGKPKQDLTYKESTLLEHSIRVALESIAGWVIVVLGAYIAGIQSKSSRLFVIENKNWQEGMASSIRCGLQCLQAQAPNAASVIFMACDQPLLSVALLNKLVTLQKESGNPVVASSYASTIGIPAIFDKRLFPALLLLTGDAGAKKLIMQYMDDASMVRFPGGEIDIDTEADYNRLKKM